MPLEPSMFAPVRATLECRGGYTVTRADRGENQREKSKVSLLLVSPYYTTLSCTWTHYPVCTDPTLHGPLTDSGCMYASYFKCTVTLEVKVEWSSDLRVEQSLEMGVERSSNSKSGAGWSSDLGVGWNLEQQKCEMGCPLTAPPPFAPVVVSGAVAVVVHHSSSWPVPSLCLSLTSPTMV